MSYAKLFGSILDSTIWDQPNHVRLVWITMIAGKDEYGVVEASVPGLARRARVTIAEVEDALRVLMEPDPYSRTPDHEGRRIEKVDGGWRLLNADKYRDKDDAAERRAKDAARQARKRARERAAANPSESHTAESRDRPDSHVTVRKVTPSDQSRASGIGTPPGPDPDRGGSSGASGSGMGLPGDLVQDPRVREGQVERGPVVAPGRPVESPESARTPAGGESEVEKRKLVGRLMARFPVAVNEARERVAAALGIAIRPVPLLGPTLSGTYSSDLRARLMAATDPEGDMLHVIAVAEAEAIDRSDPQWLSWSLTGERSWSVKLAAPLVPVRKGPKSAEPESVFDFIDRRGAERDARRARGES